MLSRENRMHTGVSGKFISNWYGETNTVTAFPPESPGKKNQKPSPFHCLLN